MWMEQSLSVLEDGARVLMLVLKAVILLGESDMFPRYFLHHPKSQSHCDQSLASTTWRPCGDHAMAMGRPSGNHLATMQRPQAQALFLKKKIEYLPRYFVHNLGSCGSGQKLQMVEVLLPEVLTKVSRKLAIRYFY